MAFRVQKQVTWLQITMQKVGRMHVLQTFQALVHDVLLVDILKDVSSDNCMQVSIHEIKDQIDVSIILSSDNIL